MPSIFVSEFDPRAAACLRAWVEHYIAKGCSKEKALAVARRNARYRAAGRLPC